MTFKSRIEGLEQKSGVNTQALAVVYPSYWNGRKCLSSSIVWGEGQYTYAHQQLLETETEFEERVDGLSKLTIEKAQAAIDEFEADQEPNESKSRQHS